MSEASRQVFFSYAWGGESERIVGELDAHLQAQGIVVVRDKRDLGYKGLIREFMQQIGRGHAIVVVVSDKYLRSPNCMFELVEMAKNQDLHDRIFPVVLQDADIYKEVNSLKYVKHWEDEFDALNQAMGSLRSQANLQGQRQALDSYDTFRDQVSRLTDLFKNMNTLTPEMHENADFSSLIKALRTRLDNGVALAQALAASRSPAAPTPQAFAAPAVAVPPNVASPVATSGAAPASAAAYLADIGQRLTKDQYEPLRGERFGPLRFKLAFDKFVKGFLASDRYRVLVLDEPALTPQRWVTLHEQVWAYAKEQNDKHNDIMIVTCLVLTPAVSDELKDAIYRTQPPKVPFAPMFLAALVAYSVAENDIFFPTELAEEADANFEDNIKKYLLP